MTSDEILTAIIANKFWVHPSRNGGDGWTCSNSPGEPAVLVYGKRTLQAAVESAVQQLKRAQ